MRPTILRDGGALRRISGKVQFSLLLPKKLKYNERLGVQRGDISHDKQLVGRSGTIIPGFP